MIIQFFVDRFIKEYIESINNPVVLFNCKKQIIYKNNLYKIYEKNNINMKYTTEQNIFKRVLWFKYSYYIKIYSNSISTPVIYDNNDNVDDIYTSSINTNEYFKIFFDICNELFFVNDLSGKFLKVNDSFIKTLGYSITELKLLTFYDLIPKGDKVNIDTKNGSVSIFTCKVLNKNGEVVWLSCKITAKDKLLFCEASDISDNYLKMTKVKEYEYLLKDAEKLSKFGCWKWCVSINELTWTSGLKEIYEFDDTEINFKNYMETNHPDDRSYIEETIKNCLESKSDYEFTHRLVTKSGILKYLYASGKYITIEGNDYIIGVGQDITSQKQIEIDLINARNFAENASNMKSSFIANMSHEIRTPINGIVGMATILQTSNLDSEQKECLNIIVDSSGILLSIINNVLDFSKIEAGKVILENIDIDLSKIINNIKDTFKMLLIKKNIELKVYVNENVPNNIIGDPIKLQQILTNLMNNAYKFTEFGSIILIVSLTKTSCDKVSVINNVLKFEVKDTGIGIPQDRLNYLFKPFEQVDSSITRNYGGSGLGLSICKNLVNLMDGNIGILSTENIGTNVWFTLPINVNVKRSKVDDVNVNVNVNVIENPKINDTVQPLIVIIEDNKVNQIVLKKLIEKIGYTNILIIDNGLKAYNLLKQKQVLPELIFMDLHMPLMDGYTCTEKLRKENILTKKGENVPIVIASANAMSGEKEKCKLIGINDFLLKPIDINELRSILKKWL
jgi:PAS domain S-box-containing protein